MKNPRTSGAFLSVQGTSILKIFAALCLFIILIFSISGLLTSLKPQYRLMSTSVNQAATNVNGELLYQLMGWENHHFLKVENNWVTTPKLTNLIFKLSSNINLNDPRSLLGRELPGFYQFDGKILVAGEGTNYTNMPVESAPPIEIMKEEREAALQNLEGLDKPSDENSSPAPGQTTGGRKVVYVYFSHNRESYLPYLKDVTDPDLAYHSQINVTKIGDQLKTSLADRGIGSFIDKTDIQAELNKKGWKFWQSYDESRTVVQTAMAGNRDLHYFIDIHRDSQRRDKTTVTINGKSYAKVAFIIGGKNPNYEKNAKLATELHKRLQEKYKGLSRGVIIKNAAGSNSIYNQNLSENAILMEFGGVDNTFNELNRSADAIADVFSDYYWQAEKVNQDTEQPSNKQ
ncbi:stage II sporulation protein P [Bacillus sp. AFS076308]|uniref:stage II sporulation protein P n=1 Tax=unclassified Bacillus (in: firmicutes) TaxID=185979 RepID=UPI000BF7062C|nr:MULTISPECIES: stage II sporulation protein P [unclassified Bacillus (in: firmicutes)]PFO03654.1 stage II sporulation protein P [Bacillus sp. AFS076308]PGV54385.1 stage II sporulation protein P [Bacillus sp. AFS037270]